MFTLTTESWAFPLSKVFHKSHKIYCIASPSFPSPGPSLTIKGILSSHSDTSNLLSITLIFVHSTSGRSSHLFLTVFALLRVLTNSLVQVYLKALSITSFCRNVVIHTYFCYFLFRNVFNDFWLSTKGNPKLPTCP